MVTELKLDYDFFVRNLPTFLQSHHGKSVLIFKQTVIGFFDNQLDAIAEGEKQFGRHSNFLVQQCSEIKSEYILSIPHGEEEDFLV